MQQKLGGSNNWRELGPSSYLVGSNGAVPMGRMVSPDDLMPCTHGHWGKWIPKGSQGERACGACADERRMGPNKPCGAGHEGGMRLTSLGQWYCPACKRDAGRRGAPGRGAR